MPFLRIWPAYEESSVVEKEWIYLPNWHYGAKDVRLQILDRCTNILKDWTAFTHDNLVDVEMNILNLNDCISKRSRRDKIGTSEVCHIQCIFDANTHRFLIYIYMYMFVYIYTHIQNKYKSNTKKLHQSWQSCLCVLIWLWLSTKSDSGLVGRRSSLQTYYSPWVLFYLLCGLCLFRLIYFCAYSLLCAFIYFNLFQYAFTQPCCFYFTFHVLCVLRQCSYLLHISLPYSALWKACTWKNVLYK